MIISPSENSDGQQLDVKVRVTTNGVLSATNPYNAVIDYYTISFLVHQNCKLMLNDELIGTNTPITYLRLSKHLDTYEHILEKFSLGEGSQNCGESVEEPIAYMTNI